MNYYENILVLNPGLDDRAVGEAVGRVKDVITRQGGEILKEDNWGRKKMAYDVKKHKDGIYVLLLFKAPPPTISELEKFYRIFDPLLKFLCVRLGKKEIAAVLAKLSEGEAREPAAEPPRQGEEAKDVQ